MKLVKLVYDPVAQQGHWLSEINVILSKAVKAEMHLKDCYNCGQHKTIIIYALLNE